MYKQVNGGVSHKYDKKEQQHEVDQPDGKKSGGYAFYELLHKNLPFIYSAVYSTAVSYAKEHPGIPPYSNRERILFLDRPFGFILQ